MNENDPQQEIFSRLHSDISSKGYDVYDGYLPPENTPYPFVYMGDMQQTDDANKTAVFGNVYQTIHVWSNKPQNRGDLSKIMLEIKNICRSIDKTRNFSWFVKSVTQRIIPDNTTKTPLLHGVLEIEFKFS